MPWPTIANLQSFLRQPVVDDVMTWALDASIEYGQTVLLQLDADAPLPDDSVFFACLDYASALYTARNGGVDLTVDIGEGSTPLQRYRKVLLVARPVGFA